MIKEKVLTAFDKKAGKIKENQVALAKPAPTATMSAESQRISLLEDMKSAVREVEALRNGSPTEAAVDISFPQYVKEKFGFSPDDNGSPESFYRALDVNPSMVTISSLMQMPDMPDGYRWLVPEVVREAIRLGLRKAPLYPNIIAGEQTITQPTIIMPYINMSDAMPTKIGEAETIPTGTMSFGQKSIKLQKVGMGIKITDEVNQFVPINLLSIFLQDMGVKMGIAVDMLAISCLINGDGNSNAAAAIGVTTPGTMTYKDLLRLWIRMGMLGRLPQSLLSNENMALTILTLPEYTSTTSLLAGIQTKNINLRTPVPQTANYDIHGGMPSNDQVMAIDATSAIIKLNTAPLRVETDRIVERGVDGTFATLTTGFANLFDDARVIIDRTLDIASTGAFPANMNVAAAQTEVFRS